MRTLIFILGGFVLLGLGLLASRVLGGPGSSKPTAVVAKMFLPVWLLIAGGNMWMGVTGAGYSVAEEFPVFLVIFGPPAIAAVFVWRKSTPVVPPGK